MIRSFSLPLSVLSILFVLFSTSLYLTLPMVASAHTLAIEGELGATLHIDPADEPVAGSPSTMYFDFKNSKREFSAAEYSFVLSITQNDSVIATGTLFENGAIGATASYAHTFAQPGEYEVQVVATPKDGDEASTFNFDTHVSSAAPAKNKSIFAFLGVHGGHFLIAVILIKILFVVVGYEKSRQWWARRKAAKDIPS
ncbi:MAG: hypothetical protein ABIQ91_01545 [Candidatus Paceibacterota bacterium]